MATAPPAAGAGRPCPWSSRSWRPPALFGHPRTVAARLAAPADRTQLARHPALAGLEARLLSPPLNPAHHFWRAQLRCLTFPIFKTALLRRNPGLLPRTKARRAFVPAAASCAVPIIEDHLGIMDARAGMAPGQESPQAA
jgi:hypothetical protein